MVCFRTEKGTCYERYQEEPLSSSQSCGEGEETLASPCSLEDAFGYCVTGSSVSTSEYYEYYYVGMTYNGVVMTGEEISPQTVCNSHAYATWYWVDDDTTGT